MEDLENNSSVLAREINLVYGVNVPEIPEIKVGDKIYSLWSNYFDCEEDEDFYMTTVEEVHDTFIVDSDGDTIPKTSFGISAFLSKEDAANYLKESEENYERMITGVNNDDCEGKYRCRKCDLRFGENEITSVDEKGNDLCPACGKPLTDNDIDSKN